MYIHNIAQHRMEHSHTTFLEKVNFTYVCVIYEAQLIRKHVHLSACLRYVFIALSCQILSDCCESLSDLAIPNKHNCTSLNSTRKRNFYWTVNMFSPWKCRFCYTRVRDVSVIGAGNRFYTYTFINYSNFITSLSPHDYMREVIDRLSCFQHFKTAEHYDCVTSMLRY